MARTDPRLTRLDATRLRVENPFGVEATLFANERVPVESAAVDELLGLLRLRETVADLAGKAPGFFEGGTEPEVARVAVTPDFHKAAGIPVGTVLATRGFLVPQAIGNDINCGMRLHVTSLSADAVVGRLDELETAARHLYFEGGRDIPMTRRMREALFREGLPGLLGAVPPGFDRGLWPLVRELDLPADLDRVQYRGGFPAGSTFGLDDFMGPADRVSRDTQIGSIGGGNHFVEIQRVERVLDGPAAYAWGLKPGRVVIMVHTGSVSVGHLCGSHFRDVVRRIHPPAVRHPANGVFVLPQGGRHAEATRVFRDSLHNAANFAFANRMFLAVMAVAALRRAVGPTDAPLLYDAPHNLVWEEELDGRPAFIHRKGACPARGYEAMAGTPFEHFGEPVLVPGSMGASSFVLAGTGHAGSLWSASHGAGRALSRGDALRAGDAEFRAFLDAFRVVTPVDFRRPDIRRRRDIVERKLEDIKKEAPFAYKGIGPIVETLSDAGIARPVAELFPLMTIKG
jgi:tRNA-splicing ligase RtcB